MLLASGVPSSKAASFRRYGLATITVFVAVGVRFAALPVLGPDRMPYLTLFAAMAFCAAYCGVGPSILGLLFCECAVFYFFTAPVFTFRLQYPVLQIGGMALFALCSALIIWMGESRRRALDNTENQVRVATSELSSLTGTLLRSQDDERRRLARELHDSVGQLLAALSMNLDSLHTMVLPAAVDILADSSSLVQEASRQIRTMSHLLHPPLLEEVGLVSALKCCVDGFSHRSKIMVTLDVSSEIGRYGQDVEIAVFRVVQECLTNIHRHSGSPTALVKLSTCPEGLLVVVQDHGKGIPPEKLAGADASVGTGLLGMKQRLAQLGGDLRIVSTKAGTIVSARFSVNAVSNRTS